MCGPCWALVPQDIKDAVWRHYRKGQERLDPLPSDAWLSAAFAAQAAVREAKALL